ncbi:PEGA domain-containing protein [Candidatus Micrarchaeota archaeon]|nr:PEGA domain-containing protein [Candidatus Micrarchaeota archaeon]
MGNKILMIIAGVLILGGLAYMYVSSSSNSNILTGENSDKVIAGAAAYPNTGAIDFKSTPSGANIYVDGAYKGLTPKTVRPVSTGSHSVKLTLIGYLPYDSTVSVRKGITSVVYVTLVPNVTISPSAEPTPTPSITPTPTPNATISPTPTITPTPTVNATPTPTPTVNATPTPTITPSPTPFPNSCSETDGGYNILVQGSNFGYFGGFPFSYNDTCADPVNLTEFYCGGSTIYNYTSSCYRQYNSTNDTISCISGMCV